MVKSCRGRQTLFLPLFHPHFREDIIAYPGIFRQGVRIYRDAESPRKEAPDILFFGHGILFVIVCIIRAQSAKVSTATQGRDRNSLEDQVSGLEKYGCQGIVKEAFTGKTMDRSKFLSLLDALQEGDTLVVVNLTGSLEPP